ncbi:hypothetical protein COMA2_180074 [Candidatus Nitrospira nitrificans]|uniref:Uncharacterized protein n=1 Tax=Candidatus Nitrospira nitrificans TaxID=1742973 RepID=A0A0S4LFF3_9BACT|nr:hypothetical protein COMA2_180074 [Candidatus Nitrospira nitrificans]
MGFFSGLLIAADYEDRPAPDIQDQGKTRIRSHDTTPVSSKCLSIRECTSIMQERFQASFPILITPPL